MSINTIEKNKQENVDLLQIEQFSDIDTSEKEIVVIEPNSTIAITIRKFLIKIGFENIHICKESNEGLQIFSHFISDDMSIPVIIDSESNKNTKKMIKEILEIQPNARVIVTTAKEKTNPEILKLINMGVSSILYKPIVFEDLRKSFSDMGEEEATPEQFEKLDRLQKQIHELESRPQTDPPQVVPEQVEEEDKDKDFESLLASYRQITDNRFRDINKIEASQADKIIKSALNDKTIILDKEISEAACNQCRSTNITYTSECPQCHGINFKQKDLVEHYDCGEIYPKESNYKTCPKCNKQIGSVGTDYREFAGYHICSSCNERFSRPLFKFSCFNCGNSFIDVMASWKKSKLYKIRN